MNLKKKMKNFFTLSRKTDGGFTLIELIVVIAVMAILAGVGTAGYAGYIKSANKKADIALVGNVMRAVETAAYNPVNDGFYATNSFGTLKSVPLGFVILSNENDVQTISVDATGTTIEQSQTKEEEFYYYTATSSGKDIYTSIKIKYLVEGSNILKGDVYVQGLFSTSLKKDVNLLSGSTFTRVDSNSKTFNTSNSTLLSDAMSAAFGTTYASDIRLKYDNWANEGINLGIMADAQESWANALSLMKASTGIIAGANAGGYGGAIGGLLGGSTSEDELMHTAVTGLVGSGQITADGKLTITNDDFMARWLNPTDKNEFFGVSDQTTYSGMRSAWNSAFADYIRQYDSCANKTAHASRIYSYCDKNGGSTANIRVVTYDILTGVDTTSTFTCAACAADYLKYMEDKSESGMLYKSGASIYEAFSMAASASQDPNFNYDEGDKYTDYFADYISQMDALYSAVESAIGTLDAEGKSYIVISVSSSNLGVVECEVLPELANPRNK